ncbi:MAG: HNH endonuclease, partial [Planctomycetota bacterium]
MNPAPSALNSHVLVLNKMWMAIRVVEARKAFAMLVREMAEVIRVDDGSYTGHPFGDWAELSAARAKYEASEHSGGESSQYEWVRTVRMPLAVPKIIRLLNYDRVPRSG